MANKDTERMIKLGEWLETYLNPEIKPREYRELAKNFIKLYNVDFELKENELSIKFFECLDKQDDETKNFYQEIWAWEDCYLENWGQNDWYVEKYTWIPGFIKNEIDPLMIKAFLRTLILDLQGGQESENSSNLIPIYTTFNYKNADDYAESVASHVIFLDSEKKAAIELLTIVHNSTNPWQHVLYEIDSDLIETKNITLDAFAGDYSKLANKLSVSHSTETIDIRTGFVDPSCFHLNVFPKNISVFPWDIALARVSLDFFELGGQNHTHFCKQCGRFTVIKRKGRKEYCSSLCRVRASNERIAQTGT